MDPISIKEYSSPQAFHISEVVGGIVLHSFGGMFTGDAIDLIFLGTDYINLPSTLHGVSISQPCDDSAARIEKEFGIVRKLEEPEGRRVFIIDSQARYFVIAAKLWIVVRRHKPGLSVKPLLAQSEAERNQFIDENVKEWYRMCALYD